MKPLIVWGFRYIAQKTKMSPIVKICHKIYTVSECYVEGDMKMIQK